MTELEEGKIGKGEVFCSMFTALLGALTFIAMNRWMGGHGDEHDDEHGEIELDEDGEAVELIEDDDEPSSGQPRQASYAPVGAMAKGTSIALEEKEAPPHPREASMSFDGKSKPRARSGSDPDMSVPARAAKLSFDDVEAPSANRSAEPKPMGQRRAMSSVSLHHPGAAAPKKLGRRSKSMATGMQADDDDEEAFVAPRRLVKRHASLAKIEHGSSRPMAAAMSKMLAEAERNHVLEMEGLIPGDVENRERSASDASSVDSAGGGGGGAAMAIWLGLTMDGIPEAMVIGILANSNNMSMALVAGVFLANFPEAIATGAMMNKARMHWTKNIGLWMSLCIMTGVIAMIAAMTFPRQKHKWVDYVTTASEGLAAGAMLAMISGTMLPDAYKKGGADLVGFWTVSGFVAVLLVRVLWPAMPEVETPDGSHHSAGSEP